MKTHFLAFAVAGFGVAACDVKVNNPPSGDTTIVNPPAEKKVENNTTIVNPPKTQETKTSTTVTGGAGTVTEKTTTESR